MIVALAAVELFKNRVITGTPAVDLLPPSFVMVALAAVEASLNLI